MSQNKSRLQQLAQENPRASGLVLFLIGAVFLYFLIIEPVIHASIGTKVSISGKGGIGGTFFALLGAMLIFFGSPALAYLQAMGSRLNARVLIGTGLVVVVYIVAIELLKGYLRSKGYVV